MALAVLASIAASSCCIFPLLLAALGIGGAVVLATLTSYRPYLLAGTAVLVGFGFYLTYRKRLPASVGDACGCERPGAGRAGMVGLWTATLAIMLFAAFPTLAARFEGAHDIETLTTSSELALERAVISVEGVDCEACAVQLRSTLKGVGGFRDLELDVSSQTVTVFYEAAAGRLDAYVAAINNLGYDATTEPAGRRASP